MDNRIQFLVRTWAAFGIALFCVTWKLWTPQTLIPQIPFFEFLVGCPGWVDWCLLIAISMSLFVCLLKPKSNYLRFGCLVFFLATASSILLNQHRLQPWAYQFLIISCLIGLLFHKPQRVLILLRWFVISIYVYSALSKFDYQFVHTIGEQMLETLAGFVGFKTTTWSPSLKSGLVLLFPFGELLVGVALATAKSPRGKWLAVSAAVVLHLTLLLLLGPLGIDHQPGVLVWNLFFILQSLLLFGHWEPNLKSTESEPLNSLDSSTSRSCRNKPIATTFVVFVIVFPLTQWIGICDHWPAWQVYSPCSSRAKLLNESSLSAWSLNELGVPIYPQARFQLAVIQAELEKQNRDRGFQIELSTQSNRTTGQRETRVLTSLDQIKMATSKYWLNTKARTIWSNEKD